MDEGKSAITSLGFIGSITSIVGSLGVLSDILGAFQNLPAEEIQRVITEGNAAYLAIMTFIGALMALVGRLKANKAITGIFKA